MQVELLTAENSIYHHRYGRSNVIIVSSSSSPRLPFSYLVFCPTVLCSFLQLQVSGLRVSMWNARSLSDKSAFVAHTLLEHHLDILTVSESWLHGSEDVPILLHSLRSAPLNLLHSSAASSFISDLLCSFCRSSLIWILLPLKLSVLVLQPLRFINFTNCLQAWFCLILRQIL